jgi:GTPase SAR1 family protein
MTSTASKLLVIGLPEAGKTTFLAALWHVAESEEVPGSLRLVRISDSAKHLNSIKNDWLQYRPVVRTIPEAEQFPSLWLKDASGSTAEIVFPDLSGETFESQWKDRQWTREYGELVKQAGCVVLFIHPDRIKEPFSITDMQKLSEAAFPEDSTETIDESEESSAAVPEEWSKLLAPTQVQLVGLLQFLQPELSVHPIRLAVIISAWDRVQPNGEATSAPQTWLAQRLPYLDQFLTSNPEDFQTRTYGLSAQGGDIVADLKRLQEVPQASDRIIIVGPDCHPHDISEPVRWALGFRIVQETGA